MVDAQDAWPAPSLVVFCLIDQSLAREMDAKGVRGERNERCESLRDSVGLLSTQTMSFLTRIFGSVFGRGPVGETVCVGLWQGALAHRRAAPVSAPDAGVTARTLAIDKH